MSRVNVNAVFSKLDRMRASGLPASPKAKPQRCGECGRQLVTASAICPRWDEHQRAFTGIQLDPIPGDSSDYRNYIGGWRGAGRSILKRLKVDNRDRRVIGGVRSAQRMQAARVQAAKAKANVQALAAREAAYQAIVWADHVTERQREAYYWTQVGELGGPLSLSKAGKKMGVTKRMVKVHADKAKEFIRLQTDTRSEAESAPQ